MVGGPSQASPGRLSPDNQALWRPLVPPASTQASCGNCKTGPAPDVPQGNVASGVGGLWARYGAERRTPKELSHYLSLDAFLQPPQHGHHRRERAAPVASPLKVLEAGWLGMRSARTTASREVTWSGLPPPPSQLPLNKTVPRTHAHTRSVETGREPSFTLVFPRSCAPGTVVGRRCSKAFLVPVAEGDWTIGFLVKVTLPSMSALGGVRLSVRTLNKSGGSVKSSQS